MKFEIKNRLSGAAQFECELGAEFETEEFRVRLGAAVKFAIKSGANLACANLAGANLADANLAGAYLAGANLAGADLACANLACAYLACANLARANLARAYLAGANLACANLARANLARANLARANLACAYLARADLAGADLGGANLADANLAGANLAGADLAGADLGGGIKLVGQHPIVAISPIGSRSDSTLFFLTNAGIKVRAGCFFGSLEEFRAAVAAKHGSGIHGREYGLACDMAELHAELWTPGVAAEPVAEAA